MKKNKKMWIARSIIFLLALSLSLNTEARSRSQSSSSFGTILMGAIVASAIANAAKNTPPGGVSKPRKKVDLDSIQDPDSPALLKSSHTAALRQALNEEQIASGLPPDPDDCDAHHIVPKKEGRKWAKEYVDNARAILDSCEINIDSVANGIYLPNKKNGARCSGAYHKTLHTAEYYKQIKKRLEAASFKGCDYVLDELNSIKSDLISGGVK